MGSQPNRQLFKALQNNFRDSATVVRLRTAAVGEEWDARALYETEADYRLEAGVAGRWV